MLKVNALNMQVGSTAILNNISFTLNKGGITALLGPSGSGKSTLLRCLGRLSPHTSGNVSFDNQALEILPADKIGIVFQSFNLFPHMTVAGNITYAPMKNKLMTPEHAREKCQQLLLQFDLDNKAERYPSELSGGQKQRVAIARMLMMNPEILLFDEPTSALDPEMVVDVADLIGQLKSPDRLIIIATHELKICKLVADNVLFLDQGHLVENCPTPTFFQNAQNPRAKAFIERMTI